MSSTLKIKSLSAFVVAILVTIFNFASAQVFTDPGFSAETVVTLSQYSVVGFRFAPDGRLFIWEKNGIVRIFKNGSLLSTPFLDISSKVNHVQDRGMLGLALDPNFATNGYVYLLYTYENGTNPDDGSPKTERLTRVTANPQNPDVALPNSEVVILGSLGTPPCSNYPAGSDCIASDSIIHAIGSLEFGPDGRLFVSIGDGAGNGVNSLALRAQDLYSYSGKILRIAPDGSAPGDNPFDDGTNSIRSKVFAYGLRNPFRIGLHPFLGEPYMGDVGWDSWEEIDRGRGGNFGWPCYEGVNPQPLYQAAYTQCQLLTADQVVAPMYTYDHSVGHAAIGGVFYTGTAYPDQYHNNYFFGDYTNGWIKRIVFDQNYTVVSVQPFATGVSGPVQFQQGPDGNLYYVAITSGVIGRIKFNGPLAVATANPTSGYSPLNVAFSSAGSIDPLGGTLTFFWDFGDSTNSTLPNPSHTYTASGVTNFTAKLTVTNNSGISSSDSLKITLGSLPPTAAILSPPDGTHYQTGQTVTFSGSASDPDDGNLPPSALQWTVLLHHETHVHTWVTATGTGGSFFNDIQDPTAVYSFEIILIATDSSGLTDTRSVNLPIDVVPAAADVSFTPNPVIGGNNSTGTLTLSMPARAGGEVVSLSSNKPEVQVPASINVPAGNTTKTFTATTSTVSNSVSATVAAVLNGTVQTTLTVNPANFPPLVNITSPLTGAFYTAPANITIQATASDPDGTINTVEFYAGSNLIGSDNTVPYSFNWNNVAQGSYTLTAKAIDNGGISTVSAPINITVYPAGSAPPPPWSHGDIGSVGGAGNATYSAGTFTVNGSGADIWGTTDAFHYVYQSLTGDVQIVARVGSLQNTNAWAKGGVMIRETLNPNSANAAMFLTVSNGLSFQNRSVTGGSSSSTSGGSGAAPYWVKLVRNANTFTGSKSTDGVNWTVVGSTTFAMANAVYVGLAVTSHDNSALCTAVMDSVTVTGNPPGNNPPTVNITSPANGATFTAPANIPINATASDTDGTINKVEFYNGSNLIGTDTSSPYGITWSGVGAGTYSLTAKATDNGGASTISSPINITVQPAGGNLPPPWLNGDIGSVGVAGNASYSGGTFTVNGSGTDIWASVDSFQYVYQSLSGDGQIIARVASLQNTNSWAKAGLMIRETLTNNASNAAMLVTVGNGLTFQRRTTVSGNTTSTSGGSGAAPYWLKLVRTGNTFTGSKSTDGTNWTLVGSATITMAANAYIGLAVTSHNNPVLCTATIDNVSLTGTPGNTPPSVSITSPADGAIFTAPANITIQATATDSDGTISQVDFYYGSNLIGTDTTSPYSINWNNVAAGTYNLTAKATDNSGAITTSTSVIITVQPAGGNLPPPWANGDVGTVGVAGNASYTGGTFTINGSGNDIWGSVDTFQFVYQILAGDCQIVARVASVQNTNGWAKAGVMIRESLISSATNATMLLTPANGLTFQRRLTTGGSTTSTSGGVGAAPYWVKLVRSGNTFTGSRSTDGANWTIVGTATINMATNIYIGLAVTSHNDAVLCTSTMDNINVTGSAPGNIPPSVSLTSPANGATFTAPANIPISATASDTDGTITQVDFYRGSNLIGTDTTSPYGITWNNVAAGSYSLTAKATDNSGGTGTSTAVNITVQPAGGTIPAPWVDTDIGSVGVPGNASYSSGTFTVNGSGSDIWASVDSFHFLYQTLGLNGQIIARVGSQQNTDPWAKTGIMIRDGLTNNAANAFVLITPANGIRFQYRPTLGGNTSSISGGSGVAPYWFKLVRSSNTFSASKSTDGTNWTLIGSATINMQTNVSVGLAVTSHDNSVLGTVVMDNVSVQ
jgi:glucose/arabinose dehydrogenase/regulation of enolase protein 1 (concanavalin A-like superfamily)